MNYAKRAITLVIVMSCWCAYARATELERVPGAGLWSRRQAQTPVSQNAKTG